MVWVVRVRGSSVMVVSSGCSVFVEWGILSMGFVFGNCVKLLGLLVG